MPTYHALRGGVAVSIALLAACRYQPTPVPLQASAADIGALAGTWEGEYSSVQSGRSGNIVFTITAGTDTAHGDVLMVPAGGGSVTAADVESRAHAMHSASPELLRVTFVRISGGAVEGALEPYLAPDCQCVVSTVFRGILEEDTVRGEYVTRGPNGLRQTGTWSVKRTSRP